MPSRSRKAAGKVGGKLLAFAQAKLAGTSNVTWNCCGGTGKHVNGCDGEIHEHFQGAGHSNQYVMNNTEMRSFSAQGGRYRSATPNGDGTFVVHVTKWPHGWSA